MHSWQIATQPYTGMAIGRQHLMQVLSHVTTSDTLVIRTTLSTARKGGFSITVLGNQTWWGSLARVWQ